MKKFFRTLLISVFLAAVIIAAIYLYPVWRAAGVLQKNMDFSNFSYEIEVELDRGELSEGQRKIFEILAKLTGFEEEALYRLSIRGSVWKDIIHAQLYPEGAAAPLVELYLSGGEDAINEALLYQAVREHLAGENALLGQLLPRQESGAYMSLAQVEQIFGIDLSGIRNFALPFGDKNPGAGQYFIMLAALQRDMGSEARRFWRVWNQAQLQVALPEGNASAVLQFSSQEPAELLAKGLGMLDKAGIHLSVPEMQLLKSFTLTVSSEGGELVMPSDYVSQSVVDRIAEIRTWISGLL